MFSAARSSCSGTGSVAIFATLSRWAQDSCWPPLWSRWFRKASNCADRSAAILVLLGYLIIHFFEHTVTPHFHFGEETHHDEFIHSHKSYSVLLRTDHPHLLRRHRHRIWISGFQLAGLADFFRDFPAQDSRRLHREFGDARQRTQPRHSLGRFSGSGGSTLAGVLTMALFRHHVGAGCRWRRASQSTSQPLICPRSQQRARHEDGSVGFRRRGGLFPARQAIARSLARGPPVNESRPASSP